MVRTEWMRVEADETLSVYKYRGLNMLKSRRYDWESSDRKFKSSHPDHFLNNLKVCQKKCPLTEIPHKKIMKLFS